jgi:hypothetical protein
MLYIKTNGKAKETYNCTVKIGGSVLAHGTRCPHRKKCIEKCLKEN